MKIRASYILYIINILMAVLLLVIAFSSNNVIRIILGLPFVLFVPGYTLIAALFPHKRNLDGIQRLALSFGLSLAIVPLLGLLLNYTWGIYIASITVSITAFIFIMSVISWLRLRSASTEEQVIITLPRFSWKERSRLDKILTIVLAVTFVCMVGTIAYTVTHQKPGQKFTEFYILDVNGNATDYPKNLQPGETGTVTLGIVNREYAAFSYRVEVTVDGTLDNTIGPIVLNNGEKSESSASFTIPTGTARQEVDFLLYENGQSDAALQLRLWVNVASQ